MDWGRLKTGVAPERARARADALYHGVREQQIKAVPNLTAQQLQIELSGRIGFRPLRDGGIGFELRKPLAVLMGIDAALLLIICTNTRPRDQETPMFVYVPYQQSSDPWREVVLHVRGAGDPVKLTVSVEQEVRALDPSLPVFDVRKPPNSP